MSSCCLCHLLPRTAGTASGLIINPGRGGGLAEVGLGPSQGQRCVCVCLAHSDSLLACLTWAGACRGRLQHLLLGEGVREALPARPRLCWLPSPIPERSSIPATGESAHSCPRDHGSLLWEGGTALAWARAR